MKAVVAAFNQEKALVGAFSVSTNLRMDFFEALLGNLRPAAESMVSTVHCGLGKTNDQMKSLHIPAGGGAGAGARCPRAASGGY